MAELEQDHMPEEEGQDQSMEDQSMDMSSMDGKNDMSNYDVGVSDGTTIDTTEDFLKVFQGKTDFDSWEEFSVLFEEFQRVTGSAFKPRSATSIEYANERRAKDKIADRFVYQTVKMVCQNFGQPIKKENSTRKKKYVGLGCEAMVHLRYKQGSLNIVSCNLEHISACCLQGNKIVSVRSFTFTDEVDFLIAKVCLEHNVFNGVDPEKAWNVVVKDLQVRDANLKTVNMRMVKKRIRFLIDRYMANINGKTPLPDDEMGIILYELAQAKQEAIDNPPARGRRKKRRVGRPRKYRPESDEDDDQDISALMDDDEDDEADMKMPRRSFAAPKPATTRQDIQAFLGFLQRKDEADRQMRQSELNLRREELELHKQEMQLQKQKFECERVERQAHLDLLKAQLEAFAMAKPKSDQEKLAQEGVTEYTIVVNNEDAFAQHAQAQIVHQQ